MAVRTVENYADELRVLSKAGLASGAQREELALAEKWRATEDQKKRNSESAKALFERTNVTEEAAKPAKEPS